MQMMSNTFRINVKTKHDETSMYDVNKLERYIMLSF